MTYLNHLTISTGHLRRSYRSEVSDEAVTDTWEAMTAAVRAASWSPMLVPGYQLMLTPYGVRAGALITVKGQIGAPLVTFGVAKDRARGLWASLVETQHRADPAVIAGKEPSGPWCAGVVWPMLALDPAAHWIADFERVAAWAWIEQ